LVVLAAVISLTVGATGAVRAQTPPAPPTTKGLLEQVLTDLLTPPAPPPAQTAVAAPVPPAPAPPPPPAPAPAAPAPDPPDTASQVIPAEYQGTIDWSRARNPRSTSGLLDALRRLEDLGFTAEEAAVMGMGQFPVAGPADWEDDWHDPRFGPPFHLHQGTDIFAERGTPVIAPEAGVVSFTDGGLGGRGAYVTTADGTAYYMAHLNAYADDVYSGASVQQGQVVAYVGNTGNAENGAPHLHFEIRPYGGAATNPKPILDDWLAAALDNVPTVLAAYGVNVPRAITSAGMLRRFDEGSLAGSGRSPETALLWASSVSAGGGTLRVAEVEAVRMAGSIDWDRRATTAQQQADVLREARSVASSVLVPLTPRLVVVLLGPAVSHGNS
jgi:murein DD-endopeptidase MepM/ murein hydrolase activator NlpD